MAQAHREHHSAVPYIAVWIALMILTTLTYALGSAHFLGKWALPVALAIATTKATLVAIIFMHLSESTGTMRLVLVIAFVFVGLLITLTLADVSTRFTLSTPAGAPFGNERSQPEGLLEHETPE